MSKLLSPSSKILLINIFGIGDVLFTTPLLRNIKTHLPGAFIGYVANPRTAPILKAHPCVDKVYEYERDAYHALYQRSKWQFFHTFLKALREIKKEGFDLMIDMSLNGNASFLMWLIGIRERVGLNYRNRSLFLSKKLNIKGFEGKHVVEYYLDVLKLLNIPVQSRNLEFPLIAEDQKWAEEIFNQHRLFAKKYVIAMVPGGGASWGQDAKYKQWSAKRFAKIADKIIENFSAQIILLGDKNDNRLCTEVAEGMGHEPVKLFGKTSIGQFGALLSKCSLAIVNDGGPLHVAVAVGTRTVSIFGPVDEGVYGPYPNADHRVVKKEIPCRPCYRQFHRAICDHVSCLNDLGVEEVYQEVESALI